MQSWNGFLPDVLPGVPGCPDITAIHALRQSANDFFTRSRVWKSALDSETLDAGDGVIDLFPPDSSSEIVRVEAAALGGRVLDPVVIGDLPRRFGSDWMARFGTPAVITALTPRVVRVVPSPSVAFQGLHITVSLRPSVAAPGVPDDFSVWFEAIAAGAKARLLVIPEQPWTNLNIAEVMAGQADAAVIRARSAASAAFMDASPRARPSWC